MAATWILVCVLAAEEGRALVDIQRDVLDGLKREAAAVGEGNQARELQQLCSLYREIVEHPQFGQTVSLDRLRTNLWSRLSSRKRSLERRFIADGRMERRLPLRRIERNGKGEGADPPGGDDDASESATTATLSLASQLDLVGQSLGGPVGLLSSTRQGRGGGAVPDFGPELVELIQRTISPDFWDVNGGPGTIVYFRPLQALVVRASGEVHGHLGGLLKKLD